MIYNMAIHNPKKILFYYPDRETKLAFITAILLTKAIQSDWKCKHPYIVIGKTFTCGYHIKISQKIALLVCVSQQKHESNRLCNSN